jgi:hypothetical protein
MVLLNESGAEVKHPGDSTLHIHMALGCFPSLTPLPFGSTSLRLPFDWLRAAAQGRL